MLENSPRASNSLEARALTPPLSGMRLWLVDLDSGIDDDSAAWLSATEQQRARKLVFAIDARRYRAAHTALRQVLLQHCGVKAGAEFRLNPFGRPRPAQTDTFSFNLSRSGDRALVGLSTQGEIGVDVEVLRPMDDVWPLAKECLTSHEFEDLRRTPTAAVTRAFLSAWTRKEACLKAVGRGLSIAPNLCEVGLRGSPATVTILSDFGAMAVQVHSLDLGRQTLGAVATVSRSHRDPDRTR